MRRFDENDLTGEPGIAAPLSEKVASTSPWATGRQIGSTQYTKKTEATIAWE